MDVDDTGSGKDRATVALVSEQVKGVERLVDAGFRDVQRQLDVVAGLPERVTRLEEQVKGVVKDQTDRLTWRRGAITAASLALFGTLMNLAISTHIL